MATLSQLINAKAIALGKLAVRATTAAGSGHPTSALALAHLTATLMYHTMRWRPEQPSDSAADRLVLSEGHAVPIIYAACADLGATFCPRGQAKRMTVDDLMTLREIDSAIDGHPNPALGFPFFDAATGSLGQGLSVAGGTWLRCAHRWHRQSHLLRHWRRRVTRGADLGGDGFHPGPAPLERRRPVQLQRTRPKRLCLARAGLDAPAAKGRSLRVDHFSDRRP